MQLTPEEIEAIEWMREWVRAGMEKRPDFSFPTDFLTAFRRIAQVPPELKGRTYEQALTAGPDLDCYMDSRILFGWRHDYRRALGLEQ